MIAFSNAKINLGLNILNKRPDGFHDIESIFYPVRLSDVIEIIPNQKQDCTIHNSGIHIEVEKEKNLCYKAWKLMHEKYGIGGIDVFLFKKIPMGAGLGGGSSNATFIVTLINQLFSLKLSIENIKSLVALLGSDCPFFVENRPSFVSGTGNQIEPISLDLSKYHIYLIYPNVHISTIDAYKNCSPKPSVYDLKKALKEPLPKWKDFIKNDFEEWALDMYPLLKEVKNLLYQMGALYAAMSGSGSTMYGIFEEEGFTNVKAMLPSSYKVFKG